MRIQKPKWALISSSSVLQRLLVLCKHWAAYRLVSVTMCSMMAGVKRRLNTSNGFWGRETVGPVFWTNGLTSIGVDSDSQPTKFNIHIFIMWITCICLLHSSSSTYSLPSPADSPLPLPSWEVILPLPWPLPLIPLLWEEPLPLPLPRTLPLPLPLPLPPSILLSSFWLLSFTWISSESLSLSADIWSLFCLHGRTGLTTRKLLHCYWVYVLLNLYIYLTFYLLEFL